MLLENGANPTIGSKSGKLPADLARMQSYQKIGIDLHVVAKGCIKEAVHPGAFLFP